MYNGSDKTDWSPGFNEKYNYKWLEKVKLKLKLYNDNKQLFVKDLDKYNPEIFLN